MVRAGTYSSETGVTVAAEAEAKLEAVLEAAVTPDTCYLANTNSSSPPKSVPKSNRNKNNHQSPPACLTSNRSSKSIEKKEGKSVVVFTIVATSTSTSTTETAKGSNSDDCDGDADCLLDIKEDTFGKRQASANNCSNNNSYSNIFRQYLTSSLNLNYKLNKKSSNKNCNQKRPPREIATGENRPISKSSSSLLSSPLSPSLVSNAFSLFKLSRSSSTASDKQNREEDKESSGKPVIGPKKQTSPPQGSLADTFHSEHNNNNQIKINESHKLISVQAENTNNNDKFPKLKINYSNFEQSQQNNDSVKVKRKGFLYLKARCEKSSYSQYHPDSNSAIASSPTSPTHHLSLQKSLTLSSNKSSSPLLDKKQVTGQKDKQSLKQNLTSKRKDLNNNYCNYNSSSISNLLSSSSNQYDGQEAYLLEEDGEDEEEEDKDLNEENSKSKSNKCQLVRLEALQVKNRQINNNDCKMSQSNSGQTNGGSDLCFNNTIITPNNKMKSNKKKSGQKASLATTDCLLIITIISSLILTHSKLTLAQLQSSAPFTRSQQLSPVSINQPLSSQTGSLVAGVSGAQDVGNSVSNRAGQLPTPQPAAGSLVANINCNKIRGHVTFTPNIRGAGTTVTTQISAGPPGEVYQWSIHQFPVKPGAAMCSCSPLILGTKLVDLSEMHGNLPSDQEFNVQSSLNLFGFDSPVGHSLMLRGMKTGMVACATFLPTSRKSNYRAKFHTPISGSVTIFQTAFGTSFISHLMYSNGTRRHSQHRFDLVKSEDDIITTSLLSGTQAGSAGPTGGRMAESFAILEQREHDNELSLCKRFNNGEALLRNMTYQLAISTENFGMRGRTSMVLPQIPFETFSSVYVVVYSEHDPNEPIACAPLKFVKPKTAAAKFQSVSVQGSVVFSQDSPYDVTVARINLNMPNSDGHSYGIDELPMIIRRKSDTRVCPNIREIIYNPHHVEPSSVPLEGEATSDQYAVGDLSGKYGSLTGKSSEKIQVNDYNLPLFGPISIVGRAMTIYSAEGVAIACSNVELTTPMTTAFATFDYGIQGQFIFRQPVNDCNGDTYVYIEVSKPIGNNGNTASASSSSINQANSMHNDNLFRSLDHNWHIHVNPVDSGLDHLSTTDCLPAGPHYNPYNTSTSNIYSRDCTPFNVLRCELGDLSAKMFTIDIPPYRVKGGQEPDIGKFFGTDIDLPLCGPVNVVNRSVVVHVQDFGSQRLACSTVIEFKPRVS